MRQFIENKDRQREHLRRDVGLAKECNGTKGQGCRIFKVKFFHYPGGCCLTVLIDNYRLYNETGVHVLPIIQSVIIGCTHRIFMNI